MLNAKALRKDMEQIEFNKPITATTAMLRSLEIFPRKIADIIVSILKQAKNTLPTASDLQEIREGSNTPDTDIDRIFGERYDLIAQKIKLDTNTDKIPTFIWEERFGFFRRKSKEQIDEVVDAWSAEMQNDSVETKPQIGI